MDDNVSAEAASPTIVVVINLDADDDDDEEPVLLFLPPWKMSSRSGLTPARSLPTFAAGVEEEEEEDEPRTS